MMDPLLHKQAIFIQFHNDSSTIKKQTYIQLMDHIYQALK